MPYVREWESLAGALQRLVEAGLSEEQAALDLCGVVADQVVAIRVHCVDGAVIAGSKVEIPPLLSPNDLCWISSRPLEGWSRRASVTDLYFDRDLRIDIKLIEVRRESVSELLLGGTAPAVSSVSNSTACADTSQTEQARADTPKPKPMNQAVIAGMQNRVKNWPVNQPPPSEAVDWEAAQAHFAPGLSREELRAVRKAKTPPEWRKQGRRGPRSP